MSLRIDKVAHCKARWFFFKQNYSICMPWRYCGRMIVNDKYEWLWPVLRNCAIIYLQELSTVTNSAGIIVNFPTQVSIPIHSE